MSRLYPAAGRREGADLALGRPLAADAFRPEAAALAAITSGYEDARARIIAAASSAPAGPPGADPAAPPGWAPTVPVDLGSGLPHPPERPRSPVGHPRATVATGRWRGLLRRRPR